MARLGIDPNSSAGVLTSQCGFEPYERDDGCIPISRRIRTLLTQWATAARLSQRQSLA